jgi:rubrerythrin
VSRLPRALEHLKTGFATEAAAAARYRACAAQAEAENLPNLAARWRQLASEKDDLAVLQLNAAGRIRSDAAMLREAISEERYENDVLYPKMIRDVDEKTGATLQSVVDSQKRHLEQLEELHSELQAATGDIAG